MIKPSEAISQPTLTFKNDEEECFYTLVLSNPDGHFTEDNAEYLHWMVGNIPSNANLSANNENLDSANSDIARHGETVCPYLQPFPPHGTGFHRFVFILYKHVSSN